MREVENTPFELDKSRHYVLHSAHPKRWAAFSPTKVHEYRQRWCDDFCLVIVGDVRVPNDFYAIPWSEVSHLFVNANTYPPPAKGGRVMPQWQIHLERSSHVFRFEFAKNDLRERPRFDATAWYGNWEVLGVQTSDNHLQRNALVFDESRAFDPIDIADARERVPASIIRRRGQPAFRDQLLTIYSGACVFSGCTVVEVLEAAHIVLYKGPETNHPHNGLLLRTDLHTLFDLHLIAVETETMTVVIDPRLDRTEYAQFLGVKLRPPRDPRFAPSRAALDEHRRSNLALVEPR